MGRGFEPTPPPLFFSDGNPLANWCDWAFSRSKNDFFFFCPFLGSNPAFWGANPFPQSQRSLSPSKNRKIEKSKNRFFGHFPLESCSGALFPFQMQHFPFQNVHISKNPFFPLQIPFQKFFPFFPVTFSLKKNFPYQKVTISLSNSQFPYQK